MNDIYSEDGKLPSRAESAGRLLADDLDVRCVSHLA
jgi:hypothetical protein